MSIHLGSSEINMGAPVQEVYVGTVKVWPTGAGIPAIAAWATPATVITSQGNPPSKVYEGTPRFYGDVSGTGNGYIDIASGTVNTFYGAQTQAQANTNFSTSIAASVYFNTSPFPTQYQTRTETNGSLKAASWLLLRSWKNDTNGDPGSKPVYFRMGSGGLIQWTTVVGISAVKNGTGEWTVSLPFDLVHPAAVIATVNNIGSNKTGATSISSVALNSFRFRAFSSANALADGTFSFMVMAA